MAVFIVLWPYLLTTKLRSVIRHNLGHSIEHTSTLLFNSTVFGIFDGISNGHEIRFRYIWFKFEKQKLVKYMQYKSHLFLDFLRLQSEAGIERTSTLLFFWQTNSTQCSAYLTESPTLTNSSRIRQPCPALTLCLCNRLLFS